MRKPAYKSSKPTFSGQDPKQLNGVMESLFRSLGLSKRYHGWLVIHHWRELVGDFIADRSNAFRYDEGTLYVSVEDPVLRQELLMRPGIMEKIKSLPYGAAINEIRFVGSRKGH